MSYLLELLGRGLIAHLSGAFAGLLGLKSNETIEELQEVVEANPHDLSAAIRLGGKQLKADNPSAARIAFESVLAQDASQLAAHIGMACAMDAVNQLDGAIEHLRAAQKLDPISPAVLFCLAYCHERLGNESQAVEYYQNAINVCPTLRNAQERLAAMALKNNRMDEAVSRYTRLCELDPHLADVQLTLANLLLKSGDAVNAIKRFEQALSLEPDNWTAHNDAASAYEQAGLIREAIEHLHKSLETQPDVADARLRLGDLYARVGNDAAATTQYERAVDLCPEYLEANVKLGTQHLRGGRFDRASRCFSNALELNDRLLTAYVGIGVAHEASGRRQDALASFEMARNIEPNSTLLFSEVARLQLRAAAALEAEHHLAPKKQDAEDSTLGDLISQQIERLKESIRTKPNHADLHYRLGLLYRNRGQVEDAIREFREATAINPAYMKALIKLGLSLAEMDRTDEAIATFKTAMDHRPDFIDLHYQLGLLFARRHEFEMAVEHFERAVEGNPQNVSFQSNLALALQNMGLVDRASATWQLVQELAPEAGAGASTRSETASKTAK